MSCLGWDSNPRHSTNVHEYTCSLQYIIYMYMHIILQVFHATLDADSVDINTGKYYTFQRYTHCKKFNGSNYLEKLPVTG